MNGRFLPFALATLPLHDAGFVSGATVVDNARTFRHTLFRWPDHLARFRRDCAACYVPLSSTDEELTATAAELVAHNAKLLPPGGELQLVTFVTPGPLGFYLSEAGAGPGTLGMVTYPLPVARYRRFFTDGVALAVAGVQSSDAGDLLPPRVKHRSRLFWHVAERSLNNPGAVPVVLSAAGVADTAIGSLLAVTGDTVIHAVPGSVQESISAKVIGELCAALGLKWVADALDYHNLPRVSELLLAGTGFCVAGVKRFACGGMSRDFAWPGPVFRALLAAWGELIGVDIAKQFTGA